MGQATNELKGVAHFKWNVNSVHAARGERSIMNPWRERMTDWLAHDAKHLSARINLIDPINLTELLRTQLTGSGSAFFVKRSIS